MDEKQEYIIAAAEKMFARFGFRKTTMDEIARAAGIGKSSLYYYFHSKEEIFAAVIRQDAHVILRTLTAAIQSGSTPHEQFRNYVQTRMAVMRESGRHAAMLRAESADIHPYVEQERQQFFHQEVDLVAGILRQGVGQRVFAVDDAAAAAKTVIALLRGLEDQWCMREHAALNREQELRVLLNLLLKGLESRDQL